MHRARLRLPGANTSPAGAGGSQRGNSWAWEGVVLAPGAMPDLPGAPGSLVSAPTRAGQGEAALELRGARGHPLPGRYHQGTAPSAQAAAEGTPSPPGSKHQV